MIGCAQGHLGSVFLFTVPGALGQSTRNQDKMSDISEELLAKKRFECDPLADDAVSAVVRHHGEHVLKSHQLYSTVRELGLSFRDPCCVKFLEFYEGEPPWNVEWKKCELGRRFFVRNSAFAGLVLMYGSLVFSFTAAFGNKVL